MGGNIKKVESSKLITDHAALGCNYAQESGTPEKDWNVTYIHFDHNHGIEQGGYGYAHADDCQPIENVGRFRKCYSPYYVPALRAIRNVSQQELQENKAAADRASLPHGFKQCLGRYLDEWFDADDSKTMYTYTDECKVLINELDIIKKSVLVFKRSVLSILGIDVYGREKLAADYDEKLNLKVIGYIKSIDTTLSGIGDLSDCIKLFNDDLTQPCNVITGIINNLNSLPKLMKNIKDTLAGHEKTKGKEVTYYDHTLQLIKEEIPKFESAMGKLEVWKPKEHHLITTDSYLVCKCGGFVKVLNDGQGFVDAYDRIVKATENLIISIKKECTEWYDGWHAEGADLTDSIVKREQLNSEQAMKKISNLESGHVNEITDDFFNTIYVEFWSHAYFDELESQNYGVLALVSVFAPSYVGVPLGIALVFYQYSKVNKDDPISFSEYNNILGTWRGHINYYQKMAEYAKLCKGLATLNDVTSVITAIPSLIYTSNATWIEEIRITFFTEEYAVVGKQKLNEDGTSNEKSKVNITKRYDYLQGLDGDILKFRMEGGDKNYESYVLTPEVY